MIKYKIKIIKRVLKIFNAYTSSLGACSILCLILISQYIGQIILDLCVIEHANYYYLVARHKIYSDIDPTQKQNKNMFHCCLKPFRPENTFTSQAEKS